MLGLPDEVDEYREVKEKRCQWSFRAMNRSRFLPASIVGKIRRDRHAAMRR
jgi:hypothetical protein